MLLLKEIDFTQSNISRYDQNGMTIKNWCITTWGAATAYGFENDSLLILAVAPYLVVCFFLIEWVYRIFQFRFIVHAAKLEKICCSKEMESYNYSLSSTAGKKLKGEQLIVLKQPHFVRLYMLLLIGSCIAILIKL